MTATNISQSAKLFYWQGIMEKLSVFSLGFFLVISLITFIALKFAASPGADDSIAIGSTVGSLIGTGIGVCISGRILALILGAQGYMVQKSAEIKALLEEQNDLLQNKK